MKKVTIASKPQASATRKAADDWVKATQATAEPNKRLTVDVPLPLHTRIKTQCAMRGEKMADVIRDLLEQHFSEGQPSGAGADARH